MSEMLQSQLASLQGVTVSPVYRQELISLMDLTRLNEGDTVESIAAFCQKAHTPYGKVAALCVYPRFVKQAADFLKGSNIKVVTVVNFPSGLSPLTEVLKEIDRSLDQGADEIDMVFPYQAYLQGERAEALSLVSHCKERCSQHILKVILETGALQDLAFIAEAATEVISAGADFVKTSTGKHSQGASLEAAATLLLTIQKASSKIIRPLGLKVAGGIHTPLQALQYLTLAKNLMGLHWPKPATFRLGASQLLDNLLAL